jgi:hypothetical protein
MLRRQAIRLWLWLYVRVLWPVERRVMDMARADVEGAMLAAEHAYVRGEISSIQYQAMMARIWQIKNLLNHEKRSRLCELLHHEVAAGPEPPDDPRA